MIDDPKNLSCFKAFIDQIEDGLSVAVIVASENDGVHFDVPLRYLPPNAKAGDHLIVSFQLDAEAKESTLERITELQRELTQNAQPDNFKL
ncbi:MAG TPA: DUF3006 domain-containing protein [Blastocatellia bacterium]|nr:DUF3006 domain-containing protein [Blastocatellia bacterium]